MKCSILCGTVQYMYYSTVNVVCLSFLGFCDLLVDISSTGVMFLPQQPFLITGSLAEQVNNLVCSP